MKPRLLGYKYSIEDKKIYHDIFKAKIPSDVQASSVYNAKLHNRTLGIVLTAVGGGLMGYSARKFYSDNFVNRLEQTDWTFGQIGVGLVILGVIANSSYTKNTIKAIDIYNQDLTNIGENKRSYVKLGASENGLGVQWKF